jgi:hypothetical protein
VNSGVHAGAVSGATRISPAWSSWNASGPRDADRAFDSAGAHPCNTDATG